MPEEKIEEVEIRPEVEFFHSFRALNYKPWHAIAEFVDNSLQSWLDHGPENLLSPNGKKTPLIVNINVKPNKIIIHDNAGGIAEKDFKRAFKPGAKPRHIEGSMNVYGMGLKSAAGNFSPLWSVTTTAMGENDLKKVEFNIDDITDKGIESLPVKRTLVAAREHYTIVTLNKIYKEKQIRGTRAGKIKLHLIDIYRNFIRDGILILKYNNEILSIPDVKILKEKYVHANEKSPKITWRKKFEFDMDENPTTGLMRSVSGFAAIVSGKGGHSDTGMPVFVSRRMIKGSGDNKHKPVEIYGKGGTYRSLRLFGEIHTKNFDLTHTKDDIEWAGHEEDIYKQVAKIIKGNKKEFLKAVNKPGSRASQKDIKEYMPLRTQLDDMRVRDSVESQKKLKEEAARDSVEDTVETIGANNDAIRDAETRSKERNNVSMETKNISYSSSIYVIDLSHEKYVIEIKIGELDNGRLFIYNRKKKRHPKLGSVTLLTITVDIDHVFVETQVGPNQQTNNVLMRMIAAHVLAEVLNEALPDSDVHSDSHAIAFNDLLERPFSNINPTEKE